MSVIGYAAGFVLRMSVIGYAAGFVYRTSVTDGKIQYNTGSILFVFPITDKVSVIGGSGISDNGHGRTCPL